MKRYRIRRCDGNKSAWLLVRCNAEWKESDACGSYTTSTSLHSLLKYAKHLRPGPEDAVQFIGDDPAPANVHLELAILQERVQRLEAAITRLQ